MLRLFAQSHRRLPLLVCLALTVGAAVVMAARIAYGHYQLADVLPESRFALTYRLTLDGHGRDVSVRTFVPQNDERQSVVSEEVSSGAFHSRVASDDLNRTLIWTHSSAPDESALVYSAEIQSRRVRYELPAELPVPDVYPANVAPLLVAEEAIQANHPEIVAVLRRIGADQGPVRGRLERIYDFTSGLRAKAFKGTTDALTALRLGEASCNGRSRLFVALARAAGIPARLVGGLILESGSKRTSHQWVEVFVNGYWVPICPTNHHFAELPARFLVLYRGDEGLFTHTADINFDYRFEGEWLQVPSEKARTSLPSINMLAHFERLKLPFSLLRTMLMLPIGALVVVLARNVAGIPTFGTFLPALIAAAMLQTGARWGTIGLLAIVVVVAILRLAVQRLELLHSPTLAVLLAAVSASMLGISLLGEMWGVHELTRMTLFPIAVLAITAERFYVALADRGGRHAFTELGGTIVVILLCYGLMHSIALQSLVVGFPEMLLLVVALDIYLGTWTGVRISEHFRFRRLLLGGAT